MLSTAGDVQMVRHPAHAAARRFASDRARGIHLTALAAAGYGTTPVMQACGGTSTGIFGLTLLTSPVRTKRQGA